MSTNIDTLNQQEITKGFFDLIRGRLTLYLFLLAGILFMGKAVARSVGKEFLTQQIRNFISFSGFTILFFLGLANPLIPYLVTILYLPFSEQIPGKFGLNITALNIYNVLFVIMIMSIFWNRLTRKEPVFTRNKLTIPVMIFLFFIFLSFLIASITLGSDYFNTMKFAFKRWIDPFLLFFITSSIVKTRKDRRDVLVAIMLGVFMTAFVSVKDVSIVTHFSWTRRIGGPAKQANILGAFCVDYIFLFLGVWSCNLSKPFAWLFLIPFGTGIKAILYTFSRGAYISFVMASLSFAFLRKKIWVIFLIVLFFLVYKYPQYFLPGSVVERIKMSFEEDVYGVRFEPSAEARFKIWKEVWGQIKERPLFGHGFGTVGLFASRYARTVKIDDVHNTYLLLWFDNGVFVLLLFLIIAFRGFFISWFVYKNSKDILIKGSALGLCAGMIGLLVANFFGSHMFTLNEVSYYWILLALMADEEKLLRSEITEKLSS